MHKYTIKLSDSNGLSANVVYVRKHASHKVEYYKQKQLVDEMYFNTEYEAKQSAHHFINGEPYGHNFKLF
jgi:hypothetical protein